MTKYLGVLVVSCLLGACSGTDASDDGSGAAGAASSGEPGDGSGVKPPAQGAVVFALQGVSPAPAGKVCPVAAGTSAIPSASETETLDADTYLHKVIDGEGGVAFSCKVIGTSSYSFDATIRQAGRGLQIKNGMLGADGKGTAAITVTDSQRLSTSLTSTSCVIDADASSGMGLQVKAGSMWARFDCAAVEAAPSDSCKASGYFVLENCDQK